MVSITSVNEVRAMERSYTSSTVRTRVMVRFGFSDQTARSASCTKALVRLRGLRIRNAGKRCTFWASPQKFVTSRGQ